MPNEIYPFGTTAEEANGDLLGLAEYGQDVQRLKGNQPGIARRALVNRVLRQCAHMSAGLAQFIANRHEPGVLDDGDLDKIEQGLEAAIEAMIAAGIDVSGLVPIAGTADLTGAYSMAPLDLGTDSDGTVAISLAARNHQAITVDHAAAIFADPVDAATWPGGEVRLWLTMAAGAAFAGHGSNVREVWGSFAELEAGKTYIVTLVGNGDGVVRAFIDADGEVV